MTMSPLKAEIGTAVTVNPVTKRLIKQLEYVILIIIAYTIEC